MASQTTTKSAISAQQVMDPIPPAPHHAEVTVVMVSLVVMRNVTMDHSTATTPMQSVDPTVSLLDVEMVLLIQEQVNNVIRLRSWIHSLPTMTSMPIDIVHPTAHNSVDREEDHPICHVIMDAVIPTYPTTVVPIAVTQHAVMASSIQVNNVTREVPDQTSFVMHVV